MNIQEWQALPIETRNELKRKFGIKGTGQRKVVQVAPGVDRVESDGVTEEDLAGIEFAEKKEPKVEVKLGAVVSPVEKPKKEVVTKKPSGRKRKTS